MEHDVDDIDAWARTAPEVPAQWFLEPDRAHGIHGAGHIRRVYVLAERLTRELGSDETARRRVLTAALWHDIGRTHDGVEPEHGARSVTRAVELGLVDELTSADVAVVLFAIRFHSLDDETGGAAASDGQEEDPLLALLLPHPLPLPPPDPVAALQTLWLLKDADALDRIRLGLGDDCDPSYLRFERSRKLIGFAQRLYRNA